MSSSVLYERLSDLGGAGLIHQDDQGQYGLTALGARLGKALEPLGAWAGDWAAALDGANGATDAHR